MKKLTNIITSPFLISLPIAIVLIVFIYIQLKENIEVYVDNTGSTSLRVSIDNQEWLLEQFTINYEAMMIACSEDNLNPEELQSCLDAFDEVQEFCIIENADQCGDEQMERLEQKLLDI